MTTQISRLLKVHKLDKRKASATGSDLGSVATSPFTCERPWKRRRGDDGHLFLFFTVLKDGGVVAPRSSSSCTQKRITGARTSVLWVQHLPRRRLGRRPPPLKKNSLNQENVNELKMSQLVCVITIPVLVFHHNPLHTAAALPWWERRRSRSRSTVGVLSWLRWIHVS